MDTSCLSQKSTVSCCLRSVRLRFALSEPMVGKAEQFLVYQFGAQLKTKRGLT